MSTRSCAVRVTIFSNVSIIPTGFKFTELHALTLAACSYALLITEIDVYCAPVIACCSEHVARLNERSVYGEHNEGLCDNDQLL